MEAVETPQKLDMKIDIHNNTQNSTIKVQNESKCENHNFNTNIGCLNQIENCAVTMQSMEVETEIKVFSM